MRLSSEHTFVITQATARSPNKYHIYMALISILHSFDKFYEGSMTLMSYDVRDGITELETQMVSVTRSL